MRNLLSDADIAEIFAFGHAHQKQLLVGTGLARYGDAHVALFLHVGENSFEIEKPALLERILRSARAHAASAGLCPATTTLNVRCIELHLYHAGGGLLDPGHYDGGSTLTVSVQLSAPGPSDAGGRFSTTDSDGVKTVHELAAGDAIVLCSEMVHNVSTLGEGATRNSLVIELWTGEKNCVGRHS